MRALDPLFDWKHLPKLKRPEDKLGKENPLPPFAGNNPVEASGAKDDLFIDEAIVSRSLRLLTYKKNVILQGPPGSGKTYFASFLARNIVSGNYDERIVKVQFHQAYSYDDFIRGYRPSHSGWIINDGVFLTLCQKAKANPSNNYVLIIDEINRGDLNQIFGEALTLLESSKRGSKVSLVYGRDESDRIFSIPPNVYVIGTMNTADRGLTHIDYATRRRFAFIDVPSAIGSEVFERYVNSKNSKVLEAAVGLVNDFNESIRNTLGEGYFIGHSYFCGLDGDDPDWRVREVVLSEILPLIEEYLMDDREQYQYWKDQFAVI